MCIKSLKKFFFFLKVVSELIRTRKDKSYDEQTDLDQNIDNSRELKTVTNPLPPQRKKMKTENEKQEDTITEVDKKLVTFVPLSSGSAPIATEKKLTITEKNKSSEETICEVETFVVNTGSNEESDEKVNPMENVKLDNNATKVKEDEYHKVDDVIEKKNNIDEVGNESSSLVTIESDENKDQEEEEESYTSLDIGEQYHDPTCTECKRAWKVPKKSELVMYLHAHAYKVWILILYVRQI